MKATAYACKVYLQHDDGKILVAARLPKQMNHMTHQEIVALVESVERDPSQLDWVPSRISPGEFRLSREFLYRDTPAAPADGDESFDWSGAGEVEE